MFKIVCISLETIREIELITYNINYNNTSMKIYDRYLSLRLFSITHSLQKYSIFCHVCVISFNELSLAHIDYYFL